MINQIKLNIIYVYKSSTETSFVRFTNFIYKEYYFQVWENQKWTKAKANYNIIEHWKQHLTELSDEQKLELL